MAKQSQNKLIKRQKEFDRKRKAMQKIARRQGKKNKEDETAAADQPDQPDQA